MLRRLSIVHVTCRRLIPSVQQSPSLSWALGSARNYAKRTSSRRNELKPVTFKIPNYMSVSDLSNMTNIKIEKLIRDLTKMGFTNVTHNYILSREYVELVLSSYNYKVEEQTSVLTPETVYDELKSPVNPKNLMKRPPIVTIMGHVDHGKTTILDYLRKSSIVSKEHGGITQHVGAFQVETPISKRRITFLDTPGHAAFLKMRERGATITDIVILVISAEDSLMPQTLEALKHARNSGNQMVVAITKIDRFSNPKQREAAIEKVNLDMMNHEIPIERIGGDVQVVPISARTGENMELLEESIVLLSDVMDLKAETGAQATLEGYILESEMKKTTGNVSTILITKGELRKGKVLICGNTYCKVRSIKNENGQEVAKATPAQAVEITGWKDLPGAGDEVIEVKNEATAKKYVAKRVALIQTLKESENVDRLNEERATKVFSKLKKENENEDESLNSETGANAKDEGPKKVNFIVKGDVSGSVEAIVESIAPLGNEEVRCNIVTASVGIPNENDMKMARITGSKLLCFNLGSLPHDIINNKDDIEVAQFNVIYKLIEDVTETLTDNLKPIYETKQVASAEIRDIFNFSVRKKTIKIAGCKVLSGQVSRNATVKIIRGADEKVVYDGTISSLKQGKDDASVVKKNNECGITFGNDFETYEPGDKVVVYEKVKVPRYL
ncbi:Tr-type G domain-containing protein [Lachancea thermotolerans]